MSSDTALLQWAVNQGSTLLVLILLLVRFEGKLDKIIDLLKK